MQSGLYRKYKLLWFLVGVFLIIAAYSAILFKPAPSSEKLVIADADQLAFSILYVADELGYLKEENLEISYRKFGSGKKALEDVISGNSDVATVYQSPVLNAALAGEPVRVLTTLHRSNRNSAVIARSDRGIKRVSDLKGKRIGVTFGTFPENLLYMMLEDESITRNDVTLLNMPPAETPKALSSGKVDAVMTRWPFVGDAEKQFPPNGTVRLYSVYSEVSVLASLSNTTESKHEALTRLLRALVKAERYIMSHQAESLVLAMQHWHRPPGAEDKLVWENIKLMLRLDNVLDESFNVEKDWLQRQSKVEFAPDALSHLFDTRYLAASKPQAVLIRENQP